MSEAAAPTETSFGFKKRNIKKPAFRRKQESSEESGKSNILKIKQSLLNIYFNTYFQMPLKVTKNKVPVLQQ